METDKGRGQILCPARIQAMIAYIFTDTSTQSEMTLEMERLDG